MRDVQPPRRRIPLAVAIPGVFIIGPFVLALLACALLADLVRLIASTGITPRQRRAFRRKIRRRWGR